MDQPYSGLYYGGHATSELTYKRCLLLYDELHIFDRAYLSPSPVGAFGSVGQSSPFRNLPEEVCGTSFRVICHEPIQGSIDGPMEQSVAADIRDPRFRGDFLKHFFETDFGWRFIQRDACYSKDSGPVSGLDLREMLRKIDWSRVEFDYERLKEADPEKMFHSADSDSLELELLFFLCKASHVVNNLLINSITTAAVPFTDIPAYHDLLLAKYDRASESDQFEIASGTRLSYLAHTVMDALLASESLERCSIEDVVKFRDGNRKPLEGFRNYLREVQHKIESEPATPEFQQEVERLLDLEILPTAKEYRDSLNRSWEKLIGRIEVRGAQAIAALAAIVLVEVPFEQLLTVGAATAGAGWFAQPVVDFINERREVTRKNGLSYLLRFSKSAK